MKKLWIIFLVMIVFSCFKEEQEKIDALGISPPSWIQGAWTLKDESSEKRGLKFTKDAFFKIDENEINVMLSYVILQGLGEDVTVEEFINQDAYSIKVSTIHSDTWYRFTKISAQEIRWNDRPSLGDDEIYIKNN